MSNSIKSLAALLAFSLAAASPPSAHARPSPIDPRIRTYFIAADEVSWDYVPGARDEIAGTPYADTAFFGKGKPRPVSTLYDAIQAERAKYPYRPNPAAPAPSNAQAAPRRVAAPRLPRPADSGGGG